MCLKNRNILFFAPAFFGYEHKIKNEMIKLGANVDFFDERSVKSSFHRALLKINPNIFKYRTNNYYNRIYNNIKNKHYDYILVVKCEVMPIWFIKLIKKNNPKAKLCLYLWDSISNIKGFLEKMKYFERFLSFDREDCQKYNIEFRPLFYINEFNNNDLHKKSLYDVCFVGTIHSDRYRIIRLIKEQIGKIGLKGYFYCYLQSHFIYYFYKIFKKEFWNTKFDDFNYLIKSSSDIAKIIAQSDVIIDIQHPKQRGLTIRTIEALGMHKKLITTNPDIANYDFYNENNISIIDRNNPIIKSDFFKSEYLPLSDEIYKKYSLEQWIFDVLGIV